MRLAFSHGFNISLWGNHPPADVDVFLAAPKVLAISLRRTFTEGFAVQLCCSPSETLLES